MNDDDGDCDPTSSLSRTTDKTAAAKVKNKKFRSKERATLSSAHMRMTLAQLLDFKLKVE